MSLEEENLGTVRGTVRGTVLDDTNHQAMIPEEVQDTSREEETLDNTSLEETLGTVRGTLLDNATREERVLITRQYQMRWMLISREVCRVNVAHLWW